MKTALVYDRVNKWGGAERVLLVLHEMFPEAPLYTSVYNPQNAGWAKVFPKVYTSFLQKIPFAGTHHEWFSPLMPLAFESFKFDKYDLIISVTSEFAKGIITLPKAKHICYCLTPTRYLWSGYEEYFKDTIIKILTKPIISYLRRYDRIAAQRPDVMIAISSEVKRRIKKYYDREAKIIFPSLPANRWRSRRMRAGSSFNGNSYFLIVSRLVSYKKVDLVIRVFNQLNYPLVIVGTGSEEKKLKKMANKNIMFVGKVTDDELSGYYSNCIALIFPQEEDFGLVAIEAMSFGKPVIAYKKGGALDFIVDGKNGVFFDEQTPEALKKAITKLFTIKFNSDIIVSTSSRFSKVRFKRELLKVIENG